jgi:hypothetical protein
VTPARVVFVTARARRARRALKIAESSCVSPPPLTNDLVYLQCVDGKALRCAHD